MVVNVENVDKLIITADKHGQLEEITYFLNSNHIDNACIVVCGDVGLGFNKGDDLQIKYVEKCLAKHSSIVIACRGNHDNPLIFNEFHYQNLFKTVPDYTIVNIMDKNILCLGGAISIDRSWRQSLNKNNVWWPDEGFVYQPKVEHRIDIICSHAAPDFVYPYIKNDAVLYYAVKDPILINDIDKERSLLTQVYNDYKDTLTHWYYGHYHDSHYELIDNTSFRLLNIAEFYNHVTDNNYKL